MKEICFTLLMNAALLMAVSPVMASGAAAADTGDQVQDVPCEKDPFCQREDWKEEFERICAQTEVATALETAQLQQLILESDELLPRLEALPRDQARLFSFRLKSCRSFFVYALQLLERQENG